MTYDDAEWHTDSVLDLDLEESAAAIHIGVYLSWATARGLSSPHAGNRSLVVEAVRERRLSPGAIAERYFASQIDPSMLTPDGNRFTQDAYQSYLSVIDEVASTAGFESEYHLPDSWDTYEQVVPHLDGLYAQWQAG